MTEYSAPALEKAIDVLEVLAASPTGFTQAELAERAGRSVGQVFRVLATLERRGFVVRTDGRYELGIALFDLAHRHPPLRGLLAAAEPELRDLAQSIRQSCNLSRLDGGGVRVVAQAESPADVGWRVRVGALFPADSPTGRLLSALAADPSAPRVRAEADAREPGITDVAVAVDGPHGIAAALTVPYVSTSYSALTVDEVTAATVAAAARISSRLGAAG